MDGITPGTDAGALQFQLQQKLDQSKLHAQTFSLTESGEIDEKKLKKAAQDFEAVFLNQVLSAMDATVDREDSLFGGGQAEKTFRGMLNEEISKSMAHRPGGSGIGLAEIIFRQSLQNATIQQQRMKYGNEDQKAYQIQKEG